MLAYRYCLVLLIALSGLSNGLAQKYYYTIYDGEKSAPFDHISELLITKDSISPHGAIWVGADNCLGLLQLKYFEGVDGLANNNVFSLAALPDGGVIINFGKVFHLSPNGDQYIVTPFKKRRRHFLYVCR